MSPKFVDRNQKMKEIAEVALSLFAKKGYGAASVEQISIAAGIGKGTLYEYFQTKEDVFVLAVMDWLTEGIDRLEEMDTNIGNPVDRLRHFVLAMDEVFPLDDPDTVQLLIEVYQQTILKGGAFNKQRHLMREIRSRVCRIIAEIILDGVSNHDFRPEIARDAERIAVNLLAYLDGIWLHHLAVDAFDNHRDYVLFYLEQLIGSMMNNRHGNVIPDTN